jgi:hypothetical protein
MAVPRRYPLADLRSVAMLAARVGGRSIDLRSRAAPSLTAAAAVVGPAIILWFPGRM